MEGKKGKKEKRDLLGIKRVTGEAGQYLAPFLLFVLPPSLPSPFLRLTPSFSRIFIGVSRGRFLFSKRSGQASFQQDFVWVRERERKVLYCVVVGRGGERKDNICGHGKLSALVNNCLNSQSVLLLLPPSLSSPLSPSFLSARSLGHFFFCPL